MVSGISAWLLYKDVGNVLFAHMIIAHAILNVFQTQEATEYLSFSRNLKRLKSLLVKVATSGWFNYTNCPIGTMGW